MARPRKVIAINTKHLSKRDRLARSMAETEMKASTDDLDNVPAWLTPDGADEYRRIIKEAKGLAIWDNLDKGILALYADSFARYIEAADHLREEGATYRRGESECPSPWLRVAEQERKAIFQASTRLGLAVTDRLRLQVPKAEAPENKFFQFIDAASRQRFINNEG